MHGLQQVSASDSHVRVSMCLQMDIIIPLTGPEYDYFKYCKQYCKHSPLIIAEIIMVKMPVMQKLLELNWHFS